MLITSAQSLQNHPKEHNMDDLNSFPMNLAKRRWKTKSIVAISLPLSKLWKMNLTVSSNVQFFHNLLKIPLNIKLI